jgi:type II secretory pathway pseudopilin PulG
MKRRDCRTDNPGAPASLISNPCSLKPDSSEQGYVLVAVIFMMVILIISLSIAIPKVREDIQRDRDLETMQRGKQYIRAIKLYYRKFNAYPPNIDALVKTNNIRFLRKRYIDPTTGKDDWKPIMWGQNKTPMVMGLFGQPLAVATGGGIGPTGGNGLNGTNGTNSSSTSGGLFNSPSGSSSSGSSFGTSSTSTAGTSGSTDQSQSGTSGSTGGTDANANPISGTSTGSAGSTGSSGSGSGSSSSSSFGSSNNPTGNGTTFGGGGIIGFSPASPKQSIYVYKKKNHYNEWEFLYSPQQDQQQMSGGNTGAIGQPASGTTTPIGGSSFGSSSNSSGTNSSGTTTTPTTPTSPQQ